MSPSHDCPRFLAIGDIHGCSRALDALLEALHLAPHDALITLGDYVDRGPDSRGVLDRLIDLHDQGLLVPLRGNHEIMMLEALDSRSAFQVWARCGGQATLASYRAPRTAASLDQVPDRHWEFLREACRNWHEIDSHFFVHANADPQRALEDQPDLDLFWRPFHEQGPHLSGKIMICGHTLQPSGRPRNLGHSICIDTGAYADLWLTALDVVSGRYWQANQQGQTRDHQLVPLPANRG